MSSRLFLHKTAVFTVGKLKEDVTFIQKHGTLVSLQSVNMWSCTAWTYSKIYDGQKPLEPLVDVHCTVCCACALRNFFFYLYGKTTVLKSTFLSLVLVVKGGKKAQQIQPNLTNLGGSAMRSCDLFIFYSVKSPPFSQKKHFCRRKREQYVICTYWSLYYVHMFNCFLNQMSNQAITCHHLSTLRLQTWTR